MPRNNTRKRQRGGATHEAGKPFIIKPQDYQGVMAPYSYMYQERVDGKLYCDFMSVIGEGDKAKYTFYRVFTSPADGNPKMNLRRAIKAQKLADSGAV